MESEHEVQQQPEPKNPLRMFIPLEVPSQRSQPIRDDSLVVSLKSTRMAPVVKRPGPFLCERRTLPLDVQAAMASGPKSYANLAYIVHDQGFGAPEVTVTQRKTKPLQDHASK